MICFVDWNTKPFDYLNIYESRWPNKTCLKKPSLSGPLVWYNNVLPEIRYIQWTQKHRICNIILNNDGNKAISWNTVSDDGKYDILVIKGHRRTSLRNYWEKKCLLRTLYWKKFLCYKFNISFDINPLNHIRNMMLVLSEQIKIWPN